MSPSLPPLCCCCCCTRPVSSAIREFVPLMVMAAISLAGGGGGGGRLSRAPPALLGVPGPASPVRGGGAGGGWEGLRWGVPAGLAAILTGEAALVGAGGAASGR